MMPYRGLVYTVLEYLDYQIEHDEKAKKNGKKKIKKLPTVILWCLHYNTEPYSDGSDFSDCHQNPRWAAQSRLSFKLLLTDFGAMEDEEIQGYGAASVPSLMLKYGRKGGLLSVLEEKEEWFREAMSGLSDHSIESIMAYSLALKDGEKILSKIKSLLTEEKQEIIMTYGRELELRWEKRGILLGEKRGRKDGILLGEKRGKKDGMLLGAKEKAYEMVFHMLMKGMQLSKISELTGIGEKELMEILSR